MIKRHTKPNPRQEHQGRHREARGVAARLQRAAGVPRVRRADAHRPQAARRRPQGPHLPQVRGSGRQMSRLKERYVKDVVPALKKEFGYTNVMAVPKIEKVVVNMGLGEATQNAKIVDTGADELGAHHRPEGRRHARAKKSIAQFKVRQGHADRHDGDAARRADVRVPRSPDEHRAAARPRLQGRLAEGVRRPRQLHARPARPAAVPGDRLHEGRQGARHERVGRHDREDRRGGAEAAAAASGMPFRTSYARRTWQGSGPSH